MSSYTYRMLIRYTYLYICIIYVHFLDYGLKSFFKMFIHELQEGTKSLLAYTTLNLILQIHLFSSVAGLFGIGMLFCQPGRKLEVKRYTLEETICMITQFQTGATCYITTRNRLQLKKTFNVIFTLFELSHRILVCLHV